MSFRHRLALFLVVTLASVQALTALFVYGYLRSDLVDKAKRELTAEMGEFTRQLNFLSAQVTDGVQLLSLDYALRSAIAKHDHDTVLSVLRNHGRRIDATRMQLIGLDGSIEADTAAPNAANQSFPFPKLLQIGSANENGTALGTIDGKVYWIVVVPVRAPVPIAFIAAFIPMDGVLLEQLRAISAVPQSIALATIDANGRWKLAAQSSHYRGNIALPQSGRQLSALSTVLSNGDGEHLTITAPFQTVPGSAPVALIVDYPLDEALAVYRTVITAMLIALVLALLAALAGAMLIVRGMSRPLETLAAVARRIAAGDYTPPPPFKQRDEVGHLADALGNMTRSIAEREAALMGAVESMDVTRREAVLANEAKSQFLTNMSHELRTPLNAIVGFSEMLEQQILGPVGVPRYVDYARDIRDSGKYLLGLIERMLDLAGAESGKLAIVREAISPGILLRESVILLRSFADKIGVEISLPDDAMTWPLILGDAPRLRQAFVNIIHNAVKFSPKSSEVTITAAIDGSQLHLRITDRGAGIDPKLLSTVVRPFHRLRSALDGREQGMGVGLPLAKAIIELHGGTLALDSAPDVGTTVCIVLPLMADALQNAA